MKLVDSRRLTGPNLLLNGPGAVIDIELEGEDCARLVEAWQSQARHMLAAVGWPAAELAHRIHRGGLTLAFSAPIDALYAATEVNEWALSAAAVQLEGGESADFDETARRLRVEIACESNPGLVDLLRSAARHQVSCLSDDDEVSVGLGAGSITFPARELPPPDEIDWQRVHDVPLVLVTGTNGKSTTVRLLACMVEAAGRSAGLCSTDWIRVGTEIVEKGDYSGPGGARQVLRHPGVEVALLETARGGILRRGLAVEHADVALVTNIAADHLGESGIYDLDELAQAKLIVHKASNRLILNADDPLLIRHGSELGKPVTWFTLNPDNELVGRHRGNGGWACRLVGPQIVVDQGMETQPVTTLSSIPITLGGAARHNVANALAAVGVAVALDLPLEAIRSGLAEFKSDPHQNPGRLNIFELGGVTVIVDFAHNPHGVAALLETAAAMPAKRRLVTTGQAGDRDDVSIRSLATTVAKARPDRVIVKELNEYLRGRAAGIVPDMIVEQLRKDGLPPTAIDRVESEMEAVRQALDWANDGDLLLLVTHSKRSDVVSYLEHLRQQGWSPGDSVPGFES